MEKIVDYTATEYGSGKGDEAIALVAGFAGPISDLEQAAIDLADTGRDAVVYTYDPGILLEGDGELLPNIIPVINDDFLGRTSNHSRHRFSGVSLGGAIAIGMQKLHPNPEHGLYAATGIDAASLVMKHRLFGAMIMAVHKVDIVRAFRRNGYTLADLKSKWQDVQIPPDTAFTIALGGMDNIIHQRKMARQVSEWHNQNPDIQIVSKRWLGHTGTIKWFNNNITSLLNSDSTNN
ncbi:MAG: hypothetical protein WAW80_01145 [Candidatus Saccharimonadales bacterium]